MNRAHASSPFTCVAYSHHHSLTGPSVLLRQHKHPPPQQPSDDRTFLPVDRHNNPRANPSGHRRNRYMESYGIIELELEAIPTYRTPRPQRTALTVSSPRLHGFM